MIFKPGRLYMQVVRDNPCIWYVVECLDSTTCTVVAAHERKWVGTICGLLDAYDHEELSDEEALMYRVGG